MSRPRTPLLLESYTPYVLEQGGSASLGPDQPSWRRAAALDGMPARNPQVEIFGFGATVPPWELRGPGAAQVPRRQRKKASSRQGAQSTPNPPLPTPAPCNGIKHSFQHSLTPASCLKQLPGGGCHPIFLPPRLPIAAWANQPLSAPSPWGQPNWGFMTSIPRLLLGCLVVWLVAAPGEVQMADWARSGVTGPSLALLCL